MPPQRIIHVDMDEFFAAVEKLDHPELRGKCLLVGGDPQGRGVVSTASYEARKFGCHSAMPMSKAIRLCPHAIVLPVRGRRYAAISEQIFEILRRFSPLVEPLSIDEAFLDVTGCQQLLGPAAKIARDIKATIRREVGLTASLGVAPNKFLAKLASDLKKPDGLVIIEEKDVQNVLGPLSVRKLWGCGPAAEKVFHRMGIETIGQVRAMPVEVLTRAFGSMGEHFWLLAQGLDERTVEIEGEAKSVGQETTFEKDVGDLAQLRQTLMGLVEQVGSRLRAHGLAGRTVTLKIRYGDFTTITRSNTLDKATSTTDTLWRTASGVLEEWASKNFRPLRLIGVTASNLEPSGGQQLGLFDYAAEEKQRRLDSALDSISHKFGKKAVRRGPKKPPG